NFNRSKHCCIPSETTSRCCISRNFYGDDNTDRLIFFFSSRRRHTRSVSAFLLNRSSDLFAAEGLTKRSAVGFLLRSLIMFQTFISRHNSNFFSDKLALTSVTPASSAPVLQTPKATSSTLYFDSLTV